MKNILVDKQNTISSARTRIEYLDIAKAIGILCIIAGHMGIAKVDRIVFTFHVPLFFLISGYFLDRSEDIVLFIKKNAKSLLIPYYFTGLCLIMIKIVIDIVHKVPEQIPKDLVQILLHVLYASGTDTNNTIGGIAPIGAIWFLYALFWAKIVARVVLKVKYAWGGVLLTVIALAAYYSSLYVWLPLDVQAGGIAGVFVYIGAVFKEQGILEKINWKIFVIGFAVLFFEVHFGICLYVVSNTYDYGIVSMAGSILISGFIIEISKGIGKVPILKKILLFYGQNTVIILCYHLIELNNAPWHRLCNQIQVLKIAPTMVSICLFCAKLIFITVCTYITLHIKCLRKVFGKNGMDSWRK